MHWCVGIVYVYARAMRWALQPTGNDDKLFGADKISFARNT